MTNNEKINVLLYNVELREQYRASNNSILQTFIQPNGWLAGFMCSNNGYIYYYYSPNKIEYFKSKWAKKPLTGDDIVPIKFRVGRALGNDYLFHGNVIYDLGEKLGFLNTEYLQKYDRDKDTSVHKTRMNVFKRQFNRKEYHFMDSENDE